MDVVAINARVKALEAEVENFRDQNKSLKATLRSREEVGPRAITSLSACVVESCYCQRVPDSVSPPVAPSTPWPNLNHAQPEPA
jgi:hypothetical protein